MSNQRNPREQAQQHRSRTGNGFIRPLALSFNAEMAPRFFKSDFDLPAHHKPFDNLVRSNGWVCTQQTHRFILTLWVTDQHPTDWDRRLAVMKPNSRSRSQFHLADFPVVPT